jgi:hypothetical protein
MPKQDVRRRTNAPCANAEKHSLVVAFGEPHFVAQLNIHLMPKASVSMPNFAPQKAS